MASYISIGQAVCLAVICRLNALSLVPVYQSRSLLSINYVFKTGFCVETKRQLHPLSE